MTAGDRTLIIDRLLSFATHLLLVAAAVAALVILVMLAPV
jgi:hypothetical protein